MPYLYILACGYVAAFAWLFPGSEKYIATLDLVRKTEANPKLSQSALSCRCSPNCLLGNGLVCPHTQRGTVFWEILTFSLFCTVSSHNSLSQQPIHIPFLAHGPFCLGQFVRMGFTA